MERFNGIGDSGYPRADFHSIAFAYFAEKDISEPMITRLTDIDDALFPF